jgi:hypothetical protein
MELFLPGLLILVFTGLFCFLVLPKLGTVVLSVVCGVTLVAVMYHHYSVFGTEYRMSTWQNSLANYTPLLVLALAILVVIGVAISLFTGKSVTETFKAPVELLQSGITASMQAMPSASSATNPITSAINTGLNNVNRMNKPVNKPANGNTKSIIPALGYRASNV